MTYQPFTFFFIPGAISIGLGALIGIRFLYFYFSSTDVTRHIQSLILVAILLSLDGFLVVTGLIADLISVNRKLLERIDWRLNKTLSEKDKD
jgi:hypothetical protein